MNNVPFPYGKNHECNKPFPNIHVMNKIRKGNSMDKANYSYLEMEQKGMTVTFVFPIKNEKEEYTKKEIKNILTGVLQQYLTKEV